MSFKSPLASGNVTVFEIEKGKPLVVRESTILAELPRLLWGRVARQKVVANLLSAQAMERAINKAMEK